MGRHAESARGKAFSKTIAAVVLAASLSMAVAANLKAQSGPGQTLAAHSTRTTDAPLPSFEVVSIKPDHSDPGMFRIAGPDPSRFVSVSTTKMLIEFAYDMKDFQVSGGPSWTSSNKFDIDAKVEDSIVEQLRVLPHTQQLDQMRLMVQSMLSERFKLTVRHETKDLPAFALTITKGGSRLTESVVPPADLQGNSAPSPLSPSRGGGPPTPPPGQVIMGMRPGGKATLTGKSAPLANLVNMLSYQLNRPILDQTGLKSTYDFSLEWMSDTGLGGGRLPIAPGSTDIPALDTSGTSLFTAIQEQLGLKLESTKRPMDTILIEHIEEPSEN